MITARRTCLALTAVLLAASAYAAEPLVTSVGPIGLTVSDADRSAQFFSEVLDFERISDVEILGPDAERLVGVFGARLRVVRLRLGRETIELTEYVASRGRPFPTDFNSNDHAFQHIAIVVRDMGQGYARLRAHGVRHASTGPQRLPDWNPNAGGIEAFYFRDPDGHFLELIHFPAGKGDPRWQAPGSELFQGIDHTAIVVSDTEQSLAVYRDLLGLRVAGGAENYGTEQEHLNNVFGARLRITALRATEGPGIEFLEYLAPRDGRPGKEDLRANDIEHWQTSLQVKNADAAFEAARRAKLCLVSPTPVDPDGPAKMFGASLLARDPDGHALLFTAN